MDRTITYPQCSAYDSDHQWRNYFGYRSVSSSEQQHNFSAIFWESGLKIPRIPWIARLCGGVKYVNNGIYQQSDTHFWILNFANVTLFRILRNTAMTTSECYSISYFGFYASLSCKPSRIYHFHAWAFGENTFLSFHPCGLLVRNNAFFLPI